MGYLSNSGTITVDAILTKKGRELLAKGQGSFNITQFALSDDEVDYDLWNPQHGLGSDYFGIVIENMPVTEAVPDETQSMKYKLITLPAGTKAIPYLTVGENLTSIQIYGIGPGSNNPATGVEYDIQKMVHIYTNQYTGQQATLRMDNEIQTYTITILDSTYIELDAATLNTTRQPSMSGNSKTYSTVTDTGTGSSKSMQFTVKGILQPGQLGVETTKSTKIIITNEKYGSRLVLPVSYTY